MQTRAPKTAPRLRAEELEPRDVPATAFALGTGANANILFRFDTATPNTIAATTPVTGLTSGDVLVGTDFRPATGQFYGVAANLAADTVQVYTVNPFTGAATAVGTPQNVAEITAATSWGVDFNPAADRIRVINDLPSDGAGGNTNNFRLNPITGALVTIDPDLDYTALPGGIGDAPEVAVAYTNSDTGTQPGGTTTLMGIVTGGDRLVTHTTAPGFQTLNNVGLLGVTTDTDNGGLDIFGPANTAVAVLHTTGATRLYTVDLATGAATLVGDVGGNPTLADISVAPVLAPIVIGGALDGTVKLATPVAGQVSITSTVTAFAGSTANVRGTTGDVNGDGTADIILVTGPGVATQLTVLSGVDNSVLIAAFDPLTDPNFRGGAFVAAGDFDGDGRAEIVVTPDQGGGPRIVIFSLGVGATTLTQRASFFGIDDPNFRGGARAAVGDVNGGGVPDLVVAAGFGGGPRIAIFNGETVFTTPTRLLNDFFAFEDTLRNGAYVAVGDINADGFGDLVFGGGPGGAPRVLTVSGQALMTQGAVAAIAAPLSNFFVAGNTTDRGGVRVATADVDGDTRADVVVGSGEGSASRVRVYLGKDFGGAEPTAFQDLDPFAGAVLADGVFVG